MNSELKEHIKAKYLRMAEEAFNLSQDSKLYPAYYRREMWHYLLAWGAL